MAPKQGVSGRTTGVRRPTALPCLDEGTGSCGLRSRRFVGAHRRRASPGLEICYAAELGRSSPAGARAPTLFIRAELTNDHQRERAAWRAGGMCGGMRPNLCKKYSVRTNELVGSIAMTPHPPINQDYILLSKA